ncbi:MAG: ABC transporter ATP-binding protein [bacterium]
MKKKSLMHISVKSFVLGAKIAPKPFWGFVILSILTGLTPLISIGSFSLLVNKVVYIIKVQGFQDLSILSIVHLLLPYILLLLASFFIPAVLGVWEKYFEIVFSERFMTGIQKIFSQKQSSLDAATLESSEYQSKIQQGNEWGKGAIFSMINQNCNIISALIAISVTLCILISIDFHLAILALLSAAPLYYVERKYSRKLFRIRRLNTDSKRIIQNRMGLFMSQYYLIELNMFNSSSKFVHEVADHMDAEDVKIISLQSRKNLSQTLLRIYTVIFSLLAGIIILQKGLAGLLPIGSMVFCFSAYNNFYGSMSNFFGSLVVLQDANQYATIWFDVFETKPIIVSNVDAIFPEYKKPPTIEFVNVSFSYDGSSVKVLQNINLTIRSAEKLAIVGLSGAGKTTLIKLLCRVYDPTEGMILVDGVNLKDIDVKTWHKYLAVMFQTYGRYNVSAEESVALGKGEYSINTERVDWSLEMAGAKSFVDKLKNGTKQLIWKGFRDGTDLSVGEHQRIAISRIFYRDALVCVLDEPTSSVDALTTQSIFQNLEEKTADKIVILISHNFSTVKQASKIIVLENGAIIEHGNHEYLYNKNGRYAELYKLQADAFGK